MNSFKNFINGEWVSAASKKTFRNINPANTRDTLGVVPRSDKRDIAKAVAAAKKAYPPWKKMPAPKRAEILFKSARILEEKKEFLASVQTREMGKPLRETQADIQEAIDTAYYYAGEGRRLFGQTTPSELENKACLTIRQPLGVCGLITPWNFPTAIPAWKIYPALICGNTMVLKPAEDVPFSALHLAQILTEAGLPDGVLNVVTGFGPEAGAPLVAHPDVALVSFTGSVSVGANVASACGKSLKKCSLELGGKNAQIVLQDADLKLAVNGALWGAFATSGQRCTATSRILLHEKIYDRFLKAFLAQTKALKIGEGDNPKTDLGPIINAKQLARITGYVNRAKKSPAKLLLGGRRDQRGANKRGFFYEPTVFTKVTPQMEIAREEVFGPVVVIIKIKSLEEGIEIVNDTAYGLSASLYTKDIASAMQAMQTIETGLNYFNSPTIGAEAHLPFGGVKNTGNGHREAGSTALDIFSEWKTISIDYSGRLQRAQMDQS